MIYFIRIFRSSQLLYRITQTEHQHEMLLNLLEITLFILTFAAVFNSVEVEHDYSFWESVYFIFVTFSTVGYGDIHPTTTLGYLSCCTMIAFLFLWLPEKV